MSEELGSYPQEYFQSEIKAFELIKFENRSAEYVSVGRVDVVQHCYVPSTLAYSHFYDDSLPNYVHRIPRYSDLIILYL